MSAETIRFDPPRRRGVIFHTIGLLICGGIAFWLFLQLTRTDLSQGFLFYLLGAVLVLIPIPILGYRLYALNRSFYLVERNGIRLQWGFRMEDIPMPEVNWVRLAEDLANPLRLPRPVWPGSVVGTRQHQNVGLVEFMAADPDQLVIIGTTRRVYAISPEDRNGFLHAFRDQTELGSMAPIPAYSAFPSFLLTEAWRAPLARMFIMISVFVSLGLFLWVGVAAPQLGEVSLGFTANGAPLDPVPAVQLFLLPVLNLLLLAAGILLASYFHRKEQSHPMAYVIWFSTSLSGALFLAAVFIILRIS